MRVDGCELQVFFVPTSPQYIVLYLTQKNHIEGFLDCHIGAHKLSLKSRSMVTLPI